MKLEALDPITTEERTSFSRFIFLRPFSLWLLRLWTLPFFGVIIEPSRKEWPMPRGLGVFNVRRDWEGIGETLKLSDLPAAESLSWTEQLLGWFWNLV